MSQYIRMYVRGTMILLGIALISAGRLFDVSFLFFQFIGLVLIAISLVWLYNDYFKKK